MLTRSLSFILFITVFMGTSHASDDLENIKPFFGKFVGEAISSDDENGARKLSIDVKETGKHSFNLTWETIVLKKDGREKKSIFSVEFRPSDRDHVYGSAMRKNLFGKWEPLNPMKGDPYIWAKVDEGLFIVYALIIRQDGGYEMQQYDRRIVDKNNIELIFHRIKDGESLRTIKGLLTRVE